MRAFAVVAALWCAAASADDAPALFKRGVEALRKSDFAAAADAFQQSYALSPKAATMCNLALTYDRWGGHVGEAVDAYAKCAEDDTSGRFVEHALARARELRVQLAAAPPSAKPEAPKPEAP
jgi:Flp pilus assembly protein TadD